jgi:hypothetical protein
VKQQPEETTLRDYVQNRLVICSLQESYASFHGKHITVTTDIPYLQNCIQNTGSLQMQVGYIQYEINHSISAKEQNLQLISMQRNLPKKWYAQKKMTHVL